jgi:hypothetical protein
MALHVVEELFGGRTQDCLTHEFFLERGAMAVVRKIAQVLERQTYAPIEIHSSGRTWTPPSEGLYSVRTTRRLESSWSAASGISAPASTALTR